MPRKTRKQYRKKNKGGSQEEVQAVQADVVALAKDVRKIDDALRYFIDRVKFGEEDSVNNDMVDILDGKLKY
jgi:uncharacterized FlaG/YvyC family protein